MSGRDRPELRAARRARGWSLADAARELERLAHTSGSPVASVASLRSLLSRWENGHAGPDAGNRALLARLYGRTPAELGLVADPVPAGGALRSRLAAAAAVDDALLRAWAEQLDLALRLDDQTGAAGAAGVVRALVDELDRTLVHACAPPVRARVALLLARAGTLAGWQDLDLGDPDRAWQRFARACEAAAVAVACCAVRPGPVGVAAGEVGPRRTPDAPDPQTGPDPQAGPERAARGGRPPAPGPVPAGPGGAPVRDTAGDVRTDLRAAADEACGEALAGQAAVLVGLGEPDAALALLDAAAGAAGPVAAHPPVAATPGNRGVRQPPEAAAHGVDSRPAHGTDGRSAYGGTSADGVDSTSPASVDGTRAPGAGRSAPGADGTPARGGDGTSTRSADGTPLHGAGRTRAHGTGGTSAQGAEGTPAHSTDGTTAGGGDGTPPGGTGSPDEPPPGAAYRVEPALSGPTGAAHPAASIARDVPLGSATAGGRAWLAAARGAALAASGRGGPARRAYDAALRALAGHRPHTGTAPGAARFRAIEAADLRRWRGQALAALGDPDAVGTLEAALQAGVRSVRERAATHAALAVALARLAPGDGTTAPSGTAPSGTAADPPRPPGTAGPPGTDPHGTDPHGTGLPGTGLPGGDTDPARTPGTTDGPAPAGTDGEPGRARRAAAHARTARELAERIGSVRVPTVLTHDPGPPPSRPG